GHRGCTRLDGHGLSGRTQPAGQRRGNVEFRTLPVVRYDNIDGQDVNIIDPTAIRAEVAAAFGSAPPTSQTAAAAKPNPSTVLADVPTLLEDNPAA
ncbi:hypothetical protein ACNJQJ_21690, partial [Mycobacterium tuberculosis]